jgi:hypothetical protein
VAVRGEVRKSEERLARDKKKLRRSDEKKRVATEESQCDENAAV